VTDEQPAVYESHARSDDATRLAVKLGARVPRIVDSEEITLGKLAPADAPHTIPWDRSADRLDPAEKAATLTTA